MARSCNIVNKASTVPQKEKEKEKEPEKTIEKAKTLNKKKFVASSSEFGTQKSVEIDLRPSEDENVKKSTPQMEIDHQEIEKVSLVEGTDKPVRIRENLDPQIPLHLIQVLRQNADLFAYSAADMPGIDLEIVTHKLMYMKGSSQLSRKRETSVQKKTKSLKRRFKSCLMLGSLKNASTLSG